MTQPPTFGIPISDKEFAAISRIVEAEAGIKLKEHKRELVKNRLRKRLNALGFRSFSEYLEFLTEKDDGTEMSHMITAISTNLTYFFREDDHFEFLTGKVLPEILKRKGKEGPKKVRCWSAGCSTGEEAYSIAMTLTDFFKNNPGWDIKILATDVSTRVLDIAKRGVYKIESVENLDPKLVRRNFHIGKKEMEGLIEVKEHLREMVTVAYLNLMDERYPFKGPFDFIFCRNVLIYFDKPTQKELLWKYHKYLDDHGYMFLGHSEGLAGTHPGFKYAAPAVYTKK